MELAMSQLEKRYQTQLSKPGRHQNESFHPCAILKIQLQKLNLILQTILQHVAGMQKINLAKLQLVHKLPQPALRSTSIICKRRPETNGKEKL